MSQWNTFLLKIQEKCPGLVSALLIGENGAIWAAMNMTATAAEAKAIITGINKGNSNNAQFLGSGFSLGGQPFGVTRVDDVDKFVYGSGKAKSPGAERPKISACCVRIKGALLVGISDNGICQPPVLISAVNQVGNWLRDNGYEV